MICPETNNAQNNMAAVSALGKTVCVLIRRLNSSCRRSIAFEVRIDFHWLFGKRVKVNSDDRSGIFLVRRDGRFKPVRA